MKQTKMTQFTKKKEAVNQLEDDSSMSDYEPGNENQSESELDQLDPQDFEDEQSVVIEENADVNSIEEFMPDPELEETSGDTSPELPAPASPATKNASKSKRKGYDWYVYTLL